MPIKYSDSNAVFSGRCDPEEADGLLEWLRRTPTPNAELCTCENLHTALAQLLIAARVCIVSPPTDAVLAACLGAASRASAADTPGE